MSVLLHLCILSDPGWQGNDLNGAKEAFIKCWKFRKKKEKKKEEEEKEEKMPVLISAECQKVIAFHLLFLLL